MRSGVVPSTCDELRSRLRLSANLVSEMYYVSRVNLLIQLVTSPLNELWTKLDTPPSFVQVGPRGLGTPLPARGNTAMWRDGVWRASVGC